MRRRALAVVVALAFTLAVPPCQGAVILAWVYPTPKPTDPPPVRTPTPRQPPPTPQPTFAPPPATPTPDPIVIPAPVVTPVSADTSTCGQDSSGKWVAGVWLDFVRKGGTSPECVELDQSHRFTIHTVYPGGKQ
jgi:hypothetical protein